MAGISPTKQAAAEHFLEALGEAEDAELEIEFLTSFFREFLLTREVYTATRDSMAEFGIG